MTIKKYSTVEEILNSKLSKERAVKELLGEQFDNETVLRELFERIDNPESYRAQAQARTFLSDYLVALGERIETIDDMLKVSSFIRDEVKFDNGAHVWFVTGVILHNKVLPIEAFVALTADDGGVGNPLPNLRSEFWSKENGRLLRDKYFRVWMENSADAEDLRSMPLNYSYKIWFTLALPDELKASMPDNFFDERLES